MFGDLLAKMQITDLLGIRIITVGCKLSKSIFSVNPAFGLIASMCGIALQFRFRSSGYSPRRFKERMRLIISHWWQHCDYVEHRMAELLLAPHGGVSFLLHVEICGPVP